MEGGGLAVITFVALVHLVDATQHMGWWGAGTTSVALAHLVDATQHVGWAVITSVALALLADATPQHMGWCVRSAVASFALAHLIDFSLQSQDGRLLYSYMRRCNNRSSCHSCNCGRQTTPKVFLFWVGRSAQ